MDAKHIVAVILGTLLVMAGCKPMQETAMHPPTGLPNNYEKISAAQSTARLSLTNFFQDSLLNRHIRTALANNQDFLMTLERIRMASAVLMAAKGALLPEVSAQAGYTSTRFGTYSMDGVGNRDTNLSPNVPEDQQIPDPYQTFMLGLGFLWEADVWGKLGARKKAAFQRWMASQEAKNALKTLLVSQVASLYYELLGLDAEKNVLEKNIAILEKSLGLSKELKRAGRENQLAIDQFEAQLLNTQRSLVKNQQDIRSVEYMVCGLLGIYPQPIARLPFEQGDRYPTVLDAGQPLDLLQYRPDIRLAERELEAARFDVESARKSFYPSLVLGGTTGFSSFDVSRWLLAPESAVYQLGAGLVAPVFQRNFLKAQLEAANAEQKVALLRYEQAVLLAFLEVLDTYNLYENLEKQLDLKIMEVEAQARSVANATDLFSFGYANYLEVLNAQQRSMEAELIYIDIKTDQRKNIAQLYRALGGGWID